MRVIHVDSRLLELSYIRSVRSLEVCGLPCGWLWWAEGGREIHESCLGPCIMSHVSDDETHKTSLRVHYGTCSVL